MNRRTVFALLGVAVAAGLAVAAAPADASWTPRPVVPSHTYSPPTGTPAGGMSVTPTNAVTPGPTATATPIVTATMTTPPPAAQAAQARPAAGQGCR